MSVTLDVDEYHHVRTPWRFRLARAGIVRTRGQPVASKDELQLGEKKRRREKKTEKRRRRGEEFQADSFVARSATKADRVATVPVGSRSRRASTTSNETSRG